MGGGTILILCLSIFLNMDQKIAQATNLIFFIPTSIAAIYVNIKSKKINFKIAKPIILWGIIGAIIGAIIAQKIDVKLLKRFGMFLILISIHEIYILIKTYRNQKNKNNNKRKGCEKQ